jgi:hypothetical protein
VLRRWTITLSGRDRTVSARLKPLPGEVERVAQLAWRFVSNTFKLHAGMELIRTVTFGQIPGNLHQRPGTRRINQCQEVGVGLLPGHCPEPKSGKQYSSVFNEVVGGVHNEVVGGVWRRRPEMRPDLLLRLVS